MDITIVQTVEEARDVFLEAMDKEEWNYNDLSMFASIDFLSFDSGHSWIKTSSETFYKGKEDFRQNFIKDVAEKFDELSKEPETRWDIGGSGEDLVVEVEVRSHAAYSRDGQIWFNKNFNSRKDVKDFLEQIAKQYR